MLGAYREIQEAAAEVNQVPALTELQCESSLASSSWKDLLQSCGKILRLRAPLSGRVVNCKMEHARHIDGIHIVPAWAMKCTEGLEMLL